MSNNVVFFAIHANEVERARAFYENAFGWRFEPWGPPDFYLIRTGADDEKAIRGALQKRHEAVTGTGMIGFECTIAVDDVDAAEKAVQTHGGKLVMPKTFIEGVGQLIQFHDPEGNIVNAMEYDELPE